MRVVPVGLPMGTEKGGEGEGARDWFEMTPTVVSLVAKTASARREVRGTKTLDARWPVVDANPHASIAPLLPHALVDFLAAGVDLLNPKASPSPGLLDALAVARLSFVLKEEGGNGRCEVDECALEG